MDDYSDLDGHKFLRMVMQLPLYDGAVRRRIEIQHSEEKDGTSNGAKKSMTMQEALAQAKAERTGVTEKQDEDIQTLQELNIDAQNPLFEYATG